MKGIKTVLFDFDGTLVDSKGSFNKTMTQAFRELGIEKVPEIEFDRGVRDILKEKIGDRELVDRILEIYIKRYKLFWEEVRIMNGTEEILEWLKQMNVKVGIVTNRKNLAEYVLPTLEKLGILKYIDTLVTSREAKKEKPDPYPFILAAEKLGVDPEECLVVGDLKEDIIAGKRAGMLTCAYLHGYNLGEVSRAKPNFEIEKLLELKEIAQKLLNG